MNTPLDTVIACKTCGLVQRLGELAPGLAAECARCATRLARHRPNSLGRTAAFALAALALYVPANIYPILQMNLYGVYSQSTVWDGCRTLFEHGEVLVAVVVFLASMVIPFLKVVGLSSWSRRRRSRRPVGGRRGRGSTGPST